MTGPSSAQHRRMHALWRQAGITDRADRLALTGRAIGRRIESSNDMTDKEAFRVLDYMQGLAEAGRLREAALSWLAAYRREEAS